MSLSRQQRRKMARDIAKHGNVTDGLKAIEDKAMKATDGAIEQLRKEEVERAKGEMQGQMFTLVLAYARIKKAMVISGWKCWRMSSSSSATI